MEFSLFELRKNVKQDSVLWGTCWNSVLSGFLSFIWIVTGCFGPLWDTDCGVKSFKKLWEMQKKYK